MDHLHHVSWVVPGQEFQWKKSSAIQSTPTCLLWAQTFSTIPDIHQPRQNLMFRQIYRFIKKQTNCVSQGATNQSGPERQISEECAILLGNSSAQCSPFILAQIGYILIIWIFFILICLSLVPSTCMHNQSSSRQKATSAEKTFLLCEMRMKVGGCL